MNKKVVVVTGASSGIGLGTVQVLVENGYHVFGSVRRESDARRLAAKFGPSLEPLIFDTTDEAAIAGAALQVRRALCGHTLWGLVNNAGIMASLGPLMLQPVAEFQKVIDVNLIGTLKVTQAFLPLLGAERALVGPPGRIIMMSSISGLMSSPFLGAYDASKHGLEGMAGSLRRELMLLGIDVIVIGPGAVKTAIWDKVDPCNVSKFRGTVYEASLAQFGRKMKARGVTGHTPELIGRGVLNALTARRPSARYAIIFKRFVNWTLPIMLPTRWLDNIMAKMFGLSRLPAHELRM